MPSYKDYQRELMPPWLKGPNGTAWAEAHGEAKDALVQRLVDAVKAHFITYAPEDGLALIGKERMIERYPGEDVESYRGRLQGAFDSWGQATTIPGVKAAVEGFGLSATVSLVRDVDPARWAEFDVTAWGPDAGSVDQALILKAIGKFKPARDVLSTLTVMEAPLVGYFGFDGDDEAFGFDDLTDAADAGILAEIV